jgi:hypothetical protein
MSVRKKVGIGLAIFGALNILDFFSPIPIPTIGISAFVVGSLFIAGGLLLANFDRISKLRLADLLKSTRSLPQEKPRAIVNPLLPVRVLELAKSKQGKLTISEVAMGLNIGLDEAEAALTALLRRGDARADVNLTTGVTSYRFPEFIAAGDEEEQEER